MRLLICAGGTGGGVYPALAVLEAIKVKADLVGQMIDVLWVGGIGGMEADLLSRADVAFEAIPAAGLHGVGLRAFPGNLLQLLRGYQQSRQILGRFRPDALFFTGGYVGVPMALAARMQTTKRAAIIVYVPDIEPGLALKLMARWATRIAISVDQTREFLPKARNLTTTGYPTRTSLRKWDRDQAQKILHLQADLPTLLVFGGSKGARSINHALLRVMPQLLSEMQVIHISGQLDWVNVQSTKGQLDSPLRERYHIYPYLHEEMGAALSSADLALTRAGASILGELPMFGLPAILVPYPHAWRYQQVNARYLFDHGAGIIIEDEQLPEKLLSQVLVLMRDTDRLEYMRKAMRSLAQPEASSKIAGLILEPERITMQ